MTFPQCCCVVCHGWCCLESILQCSGHSWLKSPTQAQCALATAPTSLTCRKAKPHIWAACEMPLCTLQKLPLAAEAYWGVAECTSSGCCCALIVAISDPDQTHNAFTQSAEGVAILRDPGRGQYKKLLAVRDSLHASALLPKGLTYGTICYQNLSDGFQKVRALGSAWSQS